MLMSFNIHVVHSEVMTNSSITESYLFASLSVFVNSEPVPGFKDGTLQMTFVELRQLLDLFIHWDWSTYLADYNNPKRQYDRVTPQTAIILLEKYALLKYCVLSNYDITDIEICLV